MQELPRRSFLLGGLAAGSVALVGCGSDSPADGPGAQWADDDGSGNLTATPTEELSFLTPTFPDGFRQAPILVAGLAQRFAFVVRDEIDIMRESAPADLTVRIRRDDQVVLETTVAQRADGIITPYFPIEATFATPGEFIAELPDHPDVGIVPFIVADRADVEIPQIGDQLPSVPTPTFDDAKGIADICTRAIECPFHEIDLVDAVANDKPTVLLIATPGFCQTDICGPVLDLLIDEAGDRGGFNVIHAEVYVDPSDFQTGGFPDLTPAVNATALPFEPALFVAAPDNTILARLDATFDRSELRDALAVL
ncbi:MAG: hypothetical protein AAF081_07010 [Actinomycetota bacterium]